MEVASALVAASVAVGAIDVVPGKGVAEGAVVGLFEGAFVFVAAGVLVGGARVGTV